MGWLRRKLFALTLVLVGVVPALTGCGSGDVAGGTALGLPPRPASIAATLQVALGFPAAITKTASVAAPSFAQTARVTVSVLDPVTHKIVGAPVTQERSSGAAQMTVTITGLAPGPYLVYVQCFDANGVSCGDAVPRATVVEGLTAVVSVTGTLRLVSVAVTPSEALVNVGGTQQFTATATYADSSTQDATYVATWSTENASVVKSASALASVAFITPATGLATGSVPGYADIFATVSGVKSPRALLAVGGEELTPDSSSSSTALPDT